ncbi:MAG: peptidoglycan DD-metalloendopeptidase family protein [Bacteroidetes bacterium]|nr:peptidoglycan DD-metalloendopeptidase family protein [Bacteroidota bacterium]
MPFIDLEWYSVVFSNTLPYRLFQLSYGWIHGIVWQFWRNSSQPFSCRFRPKTKGKENIPIFAVADGYISRIKISTGGYGKALYITHPNGFTSVYAHLNCFDIDIEVFTQKCNTN